MTFREGPLSGLFVALSFFWRIPLPAALRPDDDRSANLSDVAIWFPVAGAVIAVAPALLFWLGCGLLPSPVAAGLAIGCGMAITGALHEDGLADCADGLGGTADRERALEIMRDSHIGAYGAAALVFSVMLRWLALASLEPAAGAMALIIAHSGGRGSIATALAFSTYGRNQGAGSAVARGITPGAWAAVALVSLAIGLLVGGLAGLVAAFAGIAVAAICQLRFEARLGGYTGDTLGAMEQTGEMAVFVVLAAWWVA